MNKLKILIFVLLSFTARLGVAQTDTSIFKLELISTSSKKTVEDVEGSENIYNSKMEIVGSFVTNGKSIEIFGQNNYTIELDTIGRCIDIYSNNDLSFFVVRNGCLNFDFGLPNSTLYFYNNGKLVKKIEGRHYGMRPKILVTEENYSIIISSILKDGENKPSNPQKFITVYTPEINEKICTSTDNGALINITCSSDGKYIGYFKLESLEDIQLPGSYYVLNDGKIIYQKKNNYTTGNFIDDQYFLIYEKDNYQTLYNLENFEKKWSFGEIVSSKNILIDDNTIFCIEELNSSGYKLKLVDLETGILLSELKIETDYSDLEQYPIKYANNEIFLSNKNNIFTIKLLKNE